MPTKCLFQAFCWAITGVQWYILIFWFTSPFICASLQAYGIHSNCIYLMLQGCATYVHSHVRWMKWMSLVCCFDFLFDFCLLFYFPTYISYNDNAFSLFFFWSLCFSGDSSSHFIPTSLYTLFAGHAKLMVSLLQDIQASDQRSTMLQLVEKMKTKQKEIGWFVLSCF